jgi:hypothetical protein
LVTILDELVTILELQMVSIGDTKKFEPENVNCTNFMCSKVSTRTNFLCVKYVNFIYIVINLIKRILSSYDI